MDYSQISNELQILGIGLFLIGVAVLILFIATCCAILRISKDLNRFVDFEIEQQTKKESSPDKTNN